MRNAALWIVVPGLFALGPPASAWGQTRTRSLREGAGAHPEPSLDSRPRSVPPAEVGGAEEPSSGASSEVPPPSELDQAESADPADGKGHVGYGGVAPGEKGRPPHPPHRKNPTRITWTGFQMLPSGTSRVFLQMTSEVPYQVSDSDHGLAVTVKGARLNLRNHGRALDTHFFATPVQGVKVSQKHGTVMLEIHTKSKVAHSEHLEAQDGYQFLMVEFPAAAGMAARQTTHNK